MDEQKILELAGKLVLAGATKNEEEIANISSELAAILRQSDGEQSGDAPQCKADFIGFLRFTEKEISKMPRDFSHYFRAEGCTIHYRQRRRGNSVSYEARYRRRGYNISVSAPSLVAVKERFIKALKENEAQPGLPNVPKTFNKFATYYFEHFWKRKVTNETYVSGMYKYKNHIKPYFEEIPLNKVTPKSCQTVIDKINEKGYGKTADEVFCMLNGIFNAAIKHNIIKYNPLDLVVHTQHERVHGKALSKDEESRLLNYVSGTKYQLLFAIALYCGLRPNEYKTAKVEGRFIVAINSKQKDGKVRYKKIPITPMLAPYLEGVETIKFPGARYLRDKMREILPNNILYDLRRTFNTRCVECGVADTARKLFMGHSLGKLDNAYTDVSDEYLLIEGAKISYDLPPFLPPI